MFHYVKGSDTKENRGKKKKDFLMVNAALEKKDGLRRRRPSDYDPAAEGEAAAKRENEEIRRREFLKICKNPRVRVAARQAVLAHEILLKYNVRVYDWSIGQNGKIDAELEDDLSYEKKWISVGKVK